MEVLIDVYKARNNNTIKPQLMYHDDVKAKRIASHISIEPLDKDSAHSTRFVESFTIATAELAYSQPGGPQLIYRFSRIIVSRVKSD